MIDQLRHIQDPDLGKNIVDLNFVKNLTISTQGVVSFSLELTTPACPVKEMFKEEASRLVRALPGVTDVMVSLSSSRPVALKPAKGLEKVSAIIAVSSCKGGVGKSTVAVNLAYTLALQGARVGLFDADIYGPSLPTMIGQTAVSLSMQGQWIVPPQNRGVKLMSFGFVTASSGEAGPAMMRGPMVSQIINQLLTQTYWDELDYLILDLPPGTGDVQLTLSQLVPLTGAVVVTTPQKISYVDVVKGIQFFDTLKVPTIAVVENMSLFYCNHCDHPHKLFGEGALDTLKQRFGYQNGFQLPVEPELSAAGDSGTPFVLSSPNSRSSQVFDALAQSVAREVSKLRFGPADPPELVWDSDASKLTLTVQGNTRTIDPKLLRLRCRCANCVHEWTGDAMISLQDLPGEIVPLEIARVGNYAWGIQWSDHHRSLYPFEWMAVGAP